MTSRRTLITASIGLGLLVGWYLFRPELLFINAQVNEGLAENGQVLAAGRFHGVAHESKGVAEIRQLADGRRILRFTDFATSNGPDVRILLVAADDATDNATVSNAGYVDLGPLKGNLGDQNYTIPLDLDLAKHRAVTLWCRRFGVNFGTAPLAMK